MCCKCDKKNNPFRFSGIMRTPKDKDKSYAWGRRHTFIVSKLEQALAKSLNLCLKSHIGAVRAFECSNTRTLRDNKSILYRIIEDGFHRIDRGATCFQKPEGLDDDEEAKALLQKELENTLSFERQGYIVYERMWKTAKCITTAMATLKSKGLVPEFETRLCPRHVMDKRIDNICVEKMMEEGEDIDAFYHRIHDLQIGRAHV
eukprot:UC4_evm1s180